MARVEQVRFPADDGYMTRALLVSPDRRRARGPALLILHELVGYRHPGVRQIAKRFAEAGYVALIPDLYDRPGPAIVCIARLTRSLRRGEGQGFRDLEAARRWLAARPEVDESRIGVAGFCLGGGFATLYAVRAPVGVAAVFYGDVPRHATDLDGICPVVASYGGRDKPFVGRGRRLERHLRELGVAHDVKIYPNAGHAFMDKGDDMLTRVLAMTPLRVGYDEEASEDSWRRVFGFFEEHLGSRESGLAD